MEGTHPSGQKRSLESSELEEIEEELGSSRPSKIQRTVGNPVSDRPNSSALQLVADQQVSYTQSSNEVTLSPTRIILQLFLPVQNQEDPILREIEIPGGVMMETVFLLGFKDILSLRKANGSLYRWFNTPENAKMIARIFQQGIDCTSKSDPQGPFPILSLYHTAKNPSVGQLPYLTNVQKVRYSKKLIISNKWKSLKQAIEKNRSIQKLDLSRNNIGKDTVKFISETLQEHNENNIQELNLSFNPIGPEGVEAIFDALEKTKLQVIKLENEANYFQVDYPCLNKMIDVLRNFNGLLELDLSGVGLYNEENSSSQDSIQSLMETFSGENEHNRLQKLNLDACLVGCTEAIRFLAEALKTNKNLLELHLGNNNDLASEDVQSLAAALKLNKSLQKLGLQGNKIDSKQAKYLAEALRKNTSLQGLYLNRNRLKVNGVRTIIEAWVDNMDSMNLQEVDLMVNIARSEIQALSINNAIDKLILLSQKEVLTKDLVQKTLPQS